MSDKRRKTKHHAYRSLKDAGIDVSKHNQICPNAGSETYDHFRTKACAAWLAQINGYFVDSEVETDHGKEMDLLLWGHGDRQTYVVECETNWTEQTKREKLTNYVRFYEPIDDMLMLEVLDCPQNGHDLLEWVSDELGLVP
jgi:hypothetical protein